MGGTRRIDELRTAGDLQRRLCLANGSPTYAEIIKTLLDRLETADPAAMLLHDDPQPPVESALYLRLLGAVHRLALTEPGCPLRRFLPSTGGTSDVSQATSGFFQVVGSTTEAVAREMQVAVQTNEVGRSAPLSAALNQLTATVGAPLRLLEVGASAGLNLWLDRYFVDAGASSWGPPDSPVQLRGQFVAGTVPAPGFSVASRRGCDLTPLDPTDSRSRQVLRSFVWPEQVDRLRRLDAALSVAQPVPIDPADAVAWTSQWLAELPAGFTTVLFHSVVLHYLPADRQAEFAHTVRTAGERADESRRLAWVWFEPTAGYEEVWLVCERWPERSRIRLALANPHGGEVRWEPTPLSGSLPW